MRYIFIAIAFMLLTGCTKHSGVKPTQSKLETPAAKPDACTRAAGLLPMPEYGFRGVPYEQLNARKAVDVCSKRVKAHPEDAFGKFLLARGLTKQKRHAEAFRLLESSCKMGDDAGCTLLGSYYFNGDKPAGFDRKRAGELYKEACSHGYSPACMNLGVSHLFGSEASKDPAKGEAMIFRECERGFVQACQRYVNFVFFKMMPATNDRYLYAARKTCESGLECGKYWRMMEQKGDKAADYANASVTETACKNGMAEACERLGDYYHRGTGVKLSYKKALSLYRQTCDGGRKRTACWKAGMIVFKMGGDRKEALNLISTSCGQYKNDVACVNLAKIYLIEPSAAPDAHAAITLLKQACERGNTEGCALLKKAKAQ
jgi:TPR repeat protein